MASMSTSCSRSILATTLDWGPLMSMMVWPPAWPPAPPSSSISSAVLYLTFSLAALLVFCHILAGLACAGFFLTGSGSLGASSWGSPKPKPTTLGRSFASTGAAIPLFPRPRPLPFWYPIF